jgi:NitT/TauT family transport system substrate-binding protein
MQAVLRRHGVDPSRVRFIRDLHGDDAVSAFREGKGDFLEAGQPTTENALDAGGHLVASMGEATGPLPFSSYMTTRDRLHREPEVPLRFTRALYRAQRWMASQEPAAIAEVIAPAFPDIPTAIRQRVVARYLRQGTWARDPIVRRPGFDHLQEILLQGGFIRRRHRYGDLVDVEIAGQAMATLR